MRDGTTKGNMATQISVTLPDELLARMQDVASAEGKTVDELAAEALKRDLARRILARLKREAEANRNGMTDEQVEEVVLRAIREYREEARSR